MSSFYLDDVELDASKFLEKLADTLSGTPGGWGGVSDDLREIAASVKIQMNNMDLRALLELLPKPTEDVYFELRKLGGETYPWTCCETNMVTNKDHFTNIGRTPEEAVLKMLVRKGIVIGCRKCLHAAVDHVESGGCIFCQCTKYDVLDLYPPVVIWRGSAKDLGAMGDPS